MKSTHAQENQKLWQLLKVQNLLDAASSEFFGGNKTNCC